MEKSIGIELEDGNYFCIPERTLENLLIELVKAKDSEGRYIIINPKYVFRRELLEFLLDPQRVWDSLKNTQL